MSKKQVMKEILSEKINKDRIYQNILLKMEEEKKINKIVNKKVIYALSSCIVIFIIGFGIIISKDTFNSTTVKNPNYRIADIGLDKQNSEESLKVDLKINKMKNIGALRFDADTKTINADQLPNELKFMENVIIPQEFELMDIYKIYVRSNQNIRKYDLLHDYVFEYKKDDENDIRIALSTIEEPIRDYHLGDNNKISKIGEVDLKISQYKEMYMATFKIKNIYFDIETNGMTENELIELLQSIIIKSKVVSNIDIDIKDKEINANETIDENANINYPEYYAGKYVDNNGTNVILLCEDNESNRKNICSLFEITESRAVFKIAKYSYNYLTELQNKISRKMVNDEFNFVTNSSVMEDTNNIKVVVTTNNEQELNKIKALDTIGGAIDIQYSENNITKEDLLIEK